jgi:hypothetical protein
MYDAIEEAKDAGKLFIAAAGNYPKRPWYNNDEIPNYPANYDLDNIIAVLSTDHNDNRSSFSHFGAISVDIGAPGGSGTGSVEDIYSTKRGNAYQYMAGTSMAAPHVAGAAALVWGHRPNLSWDEVKSVLMYGADRIGSVSGLAVSDGRLNVYKALISQPGDPPTAPSMLTAIARFTTVRLRWNDNSDNEQGFKIFRKSDLHPYWQMIDRVGPNIRSYQDTGLPCNKTFWYKVCAYNGYGNSSFSNVAEAETICLY